MTIKCTFLCVCVCVCVCVCIGGGQYGRSSQQVLRYCARPAAQTGSDSGLGLYGARVTHSVLQVHSLQTHQNHLLQGRRVWGPV